jgi:hypothetical protein
MRPFVFLLITLAACGGSAPPPEATGPDPLADAGVFSRDNLTAWCIVPFDASKRGPKERAEMLERLGLKSVVYDYREEHIPTFDDEIAALREKNIKLAGWWCGGVDPRDPLAGSVGLALETLRRNQASADLWVLVQEKALEGLSQEEKGRADGRGDRQDRGRGGDDPVARRDLQSWRLVRRAGKSVGRADGCEGRQCRAGLQLPPQPRAL